MEIIDSGYTYLYTALAYNAWNKQSSMLCAAFVYASFLASNNVSDGHDAKVLL